MDIEQVKRDVSFMSDIDSIPAGLLVPHYLIHCCLYYELGHSVISDSDFDRLAKRLSLEWSAAQHPNRDLIQHSALTTTGHYIKFTNRIRSCAEMIFRATTNNRPMSINARSKGQRGEREIIDLLQPHIDEVSKYNQLDPPQLQRNTLQSDRGGFDIVGLPGFALEVKRVEKDTPGQVAAWWEQTVRQAGKELEPVLFHRMNSRPWKVMLFTRLDLGDGRRYRVPSVIKFEHFVFYMKARLHNLQLASKSA